MSGAAPMSPQEACARLLRYGVQKLRASGSPIPTMCNECAFRHGSPAFVEGYVADAVEDAIYRDDAFLCHKAFGGPGANWPCMVHLRSWYEGHEPVSVWASVRFTTMADTVAGRHYLKLRCPGCDRCRDRRGEG